MRQYYYPKWVDRNKWNEIVSIIRQYESLKEEYQSVIEGKAVAYGAGRSTAISDPTAERTIKAQKFKEKLDAIEGAMEAVPEEYMQGILDNIIKAEKFPNDADRTTYARQKKKYITAVGLKLHIL